MIAPLKTIVVVNSSNGQPKSTIVQNFIAELKRKHPRHKVNYLPGNSPAKMIFTIKKTTLAVEIPGEIGNPVLPDLKSYAEAGCDAIVCACNSRAALEKAAESLPVKYDIIWTVNYETNERTRKILNQLYVQSIIRLLGEYHRAFRK